MWLVGTGFSEEVLEKCSTNLTSKVIPEPKVCACFFPSDVPSKGWFIVTAPGIILLVTFKF